MSATINPPTFQTIGLRFAQDSARPRVSRRALAAPATAKYSAPSGDKSPLFRTSRRISSCFPSPRIVFFMFPQGAGPNAQGPDDWLNAVARRLRSFRAVSCGHGPERWYEAVSPHLDGPQLPRTAPILVIGAVFFLAATRWKRGIDSPSAWLSAVQRQVSSAHVLFRPLTGRSRSRSRDLLQDSAAAHLDDGDGEPL